MNSNGRIPLILGNSTVASASATAAAQYEVFLSFCGQDTHKGFTDFLYTYLKGATIRTFKDNEGLHVGEEIGPVLLKSLKESKISIPIFSKNYAFSEWCLRELVQMVQCHENEGQVIYPIFYDVDPYDVRHQSGSYEEAFRQHRKKRFKEKTIQGWKQALKKVGQMKGLELKKETNGSLIKVGDDDTFQMHDQLRDLGRHIVRERKVDDWGRWSRLWNTDKAMEVYTMGQGTKKIKALSLIPDQYQCLAGQKFLRLQNLRYLNLDGADLDGDFEHCLPNLRWLRWRKSKMCFSPTNFHLRNLVILDLLFSNITEESNLWSQIEMSKKLKVLNLEYCWLLRRVPSLSAFSNLERLVVRYCYSLCSLDGIEELESLRYLNASECNSLKVLPNLSRLRKLEELNVSNCELVEVPGLDKLESLERLFVRHCKLLKRLPDLSNLKKLRTLDVSHCHMLIELQGVDRLDSLETLDIFWTTSLEKLPALSNLKRLKTLYYTDEG
ncbi:hypothetical protein LguiB_013948 [Lonicera macranthoides]